MWGGGEQGRGGRGEMVVEKETEKREGEIEELDAELEELDGLEEEE